MTVLSSTAPVISLTGIQIPAFADIVDTLNNTFRTIYGADVYLGNDSQDGQWLGVLAAGINDTNAAIAAAFNARGPDTAQGAGLSSIVKINGISRAIATNSQCDILIIGTVGLTITNGAVGDGNYIWNLPSPVTFPASGSLLVTATCATVGAIAAPANTLKTIITITRGWNSCNNPTGASLGHPVELDGALRLRQTVSTSLPALTIADSIYGAVLAVAGVSRVGYHENNTAVTDSNGVPSHSISLVVEGGDALAVGTSIGLRKSPGTGTYGTTTEAVVSQAGIPNNINFFRPTYVTIYVTITAIAFPGYSSSMGVQLVAATAAYLSTLPLGSPIYWTRIFQPASLAGLPAANYFDITGLTISRVVGAGSAANIPMAFNEASVCLITNITLVI